MGSFPLTARSSIGQRPQESKEMICGYERRFNRQKAKGNGSFTLEFSYGIFSLSCLEEPFYGYRN